MDGPPEESLWMFSPEELVRMHDDIIEATGGDRGVLHRSAIPSIIDRAEFGPFEHGGGLFEKASLLLRGIAQEHPFADGNKRTAFAASAEFLKANGWDVVADDETVVQFMLRVAQEVDDVDTIRAWLKRHARKG